MDLQWCRLVESVINQHAANEEQVGLIWERLKEDGSYQICYSFWKTGGGEKFIENILHRRIVEMGF